MPDYLYREKEQELLAWKNEVSHHPLILRGARQTGKTSLVQHVGKTYFKQLVEINFDFDPSLKACFESMDPQQIIQIISAKLKVNIVAGETLLFLDEIQECPNAIRALRYFKELMPKLHVIAAGSLLEFTLREADFSMPVGRVSFMYLKPLSFYEFLTALGYDALRKMLSEVHLLSPLNESLHNDLLKLLRFYMIMGGMPGVVKKYIEQNDILACQKEQSNIMEAYRKDFGKYHRKAHYQNLQLLFDKTAQYIGQNFKYSKIAPDIRSEQLKISLKDLIDAGLVYQVKASSASGVPLIATVNERKFKALFLDVGLCRTRAQISGDILLCDDLTTLDQGMLAEQLVGQELLAYQSDVFASELFFWEKDRAKSRAEVDYVRVYQGEIVPIEVKAGKTGRLKSLQIFMQDKNSHFGVRISQQPLSFDQKVLSVPLYMVNEIERLLTLC